MVLSKEVKQWIWYVLLVVIIFAFVGFYGFNSGDSKGSFVVLKVNGKKIHIDEFQQVYEQYQSAYKSSQTGPDQAEQLAKYIEQRTVSDIIQRELISQAAEKNGIEVDSELFKNELVNMVARDKRFQDENGRFNPAIVFNAPKTIKKQMAKELRNTLISQLFTYRIYNAVKVSDAEIRNQFDFANTKVKIAYVYDADQQQQENVQNLLMPAALGNKVDKMAELMKQGMPFGTAAASSGLNVASTGFFSFTGRILMEGSTNKYADPLEGSLELYKQAFSMKPGLAGPALAVRGGKAIIVVLARQNPNWQEFPKVAMMARSEVEQSTRNDYMQQWMNTEYSTAKINDAGYRKMFQRKK